MEKSKMKKKTHNATSTMKLNDSSSRFGHQLISEH